LEQITSPLM